eukprot:1139835-Pelagomonas_calceolata.AAC.1
MVLSSSGCLRTALPLTCRAISCNAYRRSPHNCRISNHKGTSHQEQLKEWFSAMVRTLQVRDALKSSTRHKWTSFLNALHKTWARLLLKGRSQKARVMMDARVVCNDKNDDRSKGGMQGRVRTLCATPQLFSETVYTVKQGAK